MSFRFFPASALSASLLAVAATAFADISLFQDDNFRGGEYRTRDEAGNLKDVGMNDSASSIIIDRERWIVCTDAGLRGRCETLDPGRYPSLRSMGLNDQISSVRPERRGGGGGWGGGNPGSRDAIVLFTDDAFRGEPVALGMNESDLKTRNFNDRASSVIVNYGQWQVCSDANFRGRCETLDPGRYSSLRAMGLNDAVSSVRRVGRDNSWSGSGSGGYEGRNDWRYPGGGAPQVVMGRNGVGEVFFSETRCVVYYKDGRRVSNNSSCSGGEIDRADDAMDGSRR